MRKAGTRSPYRPATAPPPKCCPCKKVAPDKKKKTSKVTYAVPDSPGQKTPESPKQKRVESPKQKPRRSRWENQYGSCCKCKSSECRRTSQSGSSSERDSKVVYKVHQRIDYSPESAFLKKLKGQLKCIQEKEKNILKNEPKANVVKIMVKPREHKSKVNIEHKEKKIETAKPKECKRLERPKSSFRRKSSEESGVKDKDNASEQMCPSRMSDVCLCSHKSAKDKMNLNEYLKRCQSVCHPLPPSSCFCQKQPNERQERMDIVNRKKVTNTSSGSNMCIKKNCEICLQKKQKEERRLEEIDNFCSSPLSPLSSSRPSPRITCFCNDCLAYCERCWRYAIPDPEPQRPCQEYDPTIRTRSCSPDSRSSSPRCLKCHFNPIEEQDYCPHYTLPTAAYRIRCHSASPVRRSVKSGKRLSRSPVYHTKITPKPGAHGDHCERPCRAPCATLRKTRKQSRFKRVPKMMESKKPWNPSTKINRTFSQEKPISVFKNFKRTKSAGTQFRAQSSPSRLPQKNYCKDVGTQYSLHSPICSCRYEFQNIIPKDKPDLIDQACKPRVIESPRRIRDVYKSVSDSEKGFCCNCGMCYMYTKAKDNCPSIERKNCRWHPSLECRCSIPDKDKDKNVKPACYDFTYAKRPEPQKITPRPEVPFLFQYPLGCEKQKQDVRKLKDSYKKLKQIPSESMALRFQKGVK